MHKALTLSTATERMFISVLYFRHRANPQQMLSSELGHTPKSVKLSMESEPWKSLTKKETLVA